MLRDQTKPDRETSLWHNLMLDAHHLSLLTEMPARRSREVATVELKDITDRPAALQQVLLHHSRVFKLVDSKMQEEEKIDPFSYSFVCNGLFLLLSFNIYYNRVHIVLNYHMNKMPSRTNNGKRETLQCNITI